MKKNREIVLNAIRSTLSQIAPAGTKVVLFGSRARGDARDDSDWDILIILDKTKLRRTTMIIFHIHSENWGGN